ncbi:hypothetical protein MMC20_001891 [Loxospora ochrophaea]|nr:hypothetical protein [Loxospora ochrophaea]
MAKLGWIGLGNMGRGMCKNLVEKGNLRTHLIIFNRTQKRAADLQAKLPSGKSTVASNLEEVVEKSDIIFTCLGDDAAIIDTIANAVKTNVKGKLFVDCSTVHPDTTNMLTKTIEAQGAAFVACPVFGAPAMADNGQLICVFAGPKSETDKIRPYMKGVMGRANIDYSDQSPGQATTLKLIGNTMILNMVESLAEAHTVAEKSKLGTDNLHQFVEAMFPGPYTAYSTRMTSGDYHKRDEPLFAVDLALKDAKHALSLANASGARMRSIEVAEGHLSDVKKEKGTKGDLAGIYGAVRQESGLKYDN